MTIYSQILKKAFTLFLSLCLTVALVSCADDGDVGPQGEKGDAGAKGDTGAEGAAGSDAQQKAGSFEGTITGMRSDDETPISETFKFEYGDYGVYSGEVDELYLSSSSTLTDNSPYINLNAIIQDKGLPTESIVPYYFYIHYTKEVSATTIFQFNGQFYYDNYPSTVTITNYVHNQTTGVVTFDFKYEGEGSDNSSGNQVTITGKFDSGKAIYTNIVGRKGA
jgi:hypothetical protein